MHNSKRCFWKLECNICNCHGTFYLPLSGLQKPLLVVQSYLEKVNQAKRLKRQKPFWRPAVVSHGNIILRAAQHKTQPHLIPWLADISALLTAASSCWWKFCSDCQAAVTAKLQVLQEKLSALKEYFQPRSPAWNHLSLLNLHVSECCISLVCKLDSHNPHESISNQIDVFT